VPFPDLDQVIRQNLEEPKPVMEISGEGIDGGMRKIANMVERGRDGKDENGLGPDRRLASDSHRSHLVKKIRMDSEST